MTGPYVGQRPWTPLIELLAQVSGPVTPAIARDHIQLVLTDRSRLTEGRDFGVVAVKSWRLADRSTGQRQKLR